jgi:hypothetical protein
MGPEPVVGSVTPDQGAFYLLQAGSEPVTEISPVSISNGLAWNRHNTQLYYIDTATGQVDVFDFDLERAKIGEYCCCSQIHLKIILYVKYPISGTDSIRKGLLKAFWD